MNPKRFAVLTFVGSITLAAFAITAETDRFSSVFRVEIDGLVVNLDRKSAITIGNVPVEIRKLQNRRIRIHGYMYPTPTESGISEFLLNGETKNESIRFTVPIERTPIHYYIPVRLKAGDSTDFSLKPVIVEGRFRVEVVRSEGVVYYIYAIDEATVTPTSPRKGFSRSVGFGC